MNKGVLYGIILVLVVVGGYFAYQAYERDQNSFQVEIGPNGVKVDPPSSD
ncbi:uncharacterized protein YxeA [Rhodoligotrophos appendicifer]|nr:hypothetical protein [Rhodoligotrophos appendicifer]